MGKNLQGQGAKIGISSCSGKGKKPHYKSTEGRVSKSGSGEKSDKRRCLEQFVRVKIRRGVGKKARREHGHARQSRVLIEPFRSTSRI